MPTGPKGEKRPVDVIGNAVKVMRIATAEETDELPTMQRPRSQGARGQSGTARAARMSAQQRADIARIAATARWKKGKP